MSSVAVGHPSLNTPRMDAETYKHRKDQYIELLWKSFPNAKSIGTGSDAPGKTDFGDIDVIVIDDGEVDWAKVATELGAVAWVNRGTDTKPACSLAVYLDGSSSTLPPVKYVLSTKIDPLQREVSSEVDVKSYTQLDINKIGSALKDWTMFSSSWGDLAGILGMVVTNFGFDITEAGLRLRLQEWDDSSLEEWKHFAPRKDEGKMMLTSDPKQTMEFFGLSVERYNAGFLTVEEIFQWMSECRLISRYCLKRERTAPVTREEKNKHRNMFNRFFADWLPAHLTAKNTATDPSSNDADQNLLLPLSQLRQTYLEEALKFFNKREQYTTFHQALLDKRGLETAEARLKPIIAKHSRKTGKALAELMRAFRRNVEFRDGQPCILAHERQDTDSLLNTFLDHTGRELQDSEAVDAWIAVNFDEVKDVERKRKENRKASVTALG